MKMTIKTGDNVIVIAGKEKGKSGKVISVNNEANKVVVENINIVSKHQKPRSQQDKGGIIKKPAAIDASNVMVVCPVCGKATRVGHTEIDGKKVRICKKCNASLDKEFVKQTKKEAKKTIKAADLKNTKLKVASKEEVKEENLPAPEVKVEKAAKPAAKKTTSTSTAKKTTSTTAKKSTAKKETK